MEAVIRLFVMGTIPGTNVQITLNQVLIIWAILSGLFAVRVGFGLIRRYRHRQPRVPADLSPLELIAL